MANEDATERAQNVARMRAQIGSFETDGEVRVPPAGIVAIGFLVSAILLSVAPIIRAASRQISPA